MSWTYDTPTASSRWRAIETSSPKEFIDALSPDAQWFGGLFQGWIFRGQENAEWTLSPSAFRQNDLLYHPFLPDPFQGWTNAIQFEAELHVIQRFFDIADANGLRLPEDSQNLRFTLRQAGH